MGKMNERKISLGEEIIFFIIVTLFWFAQYIYIPYQTTYLIDLGVTNSFVGMIMGAYGVSQMLLRFPVGILADYNNSHKKFIISGCLASGMASFLGLYGVLEKVFFLLTYFQDLLQLCGYLLWFFTYNTLIFKNNRRQQEK